jgi:hypothetical protein
MCFIDVGVRYQRTSHQRVRGKISHKILYETIGTKTEKIRPKIDINTSKYLAGALTKGLKTIKGQSKTVDNWAAVMSIGTRTSSDTFEFHDVIPLVIFNGTGRYIDNVGKSRHRHVHLWMKKTSNRHTKCGKRRLKKSKLYLHVVY